MSRKTVQMRRQQAAASKRCRDNREIVRSAQERLLAGYAALRDDAPATEVTELRELREKVHAGGKPLGNPDPPNAVKDPPETGRLSKGKAKQARNNWAQYTRRIREKYATHYLIGRLNAALRVDLAPEGRAKRIQEAFDGVRELPVPENCRIFTERGGARRPKRKPPAQEVEETGSETEPEPVDDVQAWIVGEARIREAKRMAGWRPQRPSVALLVNEMINPEGVALYFGRGGK